MRTEEAVAELKKFLKDFAELGENLTAQMDERQPLKLPPFKIPGWTDPGDVIEIYLGLRRVWIPEPSADLKLFTKIKKRTVVVAATVGREGNLTIECKHPLDLHNSTTYYSSSANVQALICFILFCQLIKPFTKSIITALKKTRVKLKVQEKISEKTIANLESSLLSIIPFIVADGLE